jgi:hypothetical protein
VAASEPTKTRMSDTSICGSSRAAKWPPRCITLQWVTL